MGNTVKPCSTELLNISITYSVMGFILYVTEQAQNHKNKALGVAYILQ